MGLFFLFFEKGENFISPRKEVDYTSNARSVRDALSLARALANIFFTNDMLKQKRQKCKKRMDVLHPISKTPRKFRSYWA